MKPSLFTLFKRGKYYRPPPPSLDGNTEAEEAAVEREHKQAERFAAAAVGFCLRHDENFLKLFWNNVCSKGDDPPLTPDAEITIEEKNWSDLKIQNGKSVYVVEFKINAPLADKQNPNKPAFAEPGGYGHDMSNSELTYRYVILGHSEPLGLGQGKRKCGVLCSEQKWSVLSEGLRRSGNPLVRDLFGCLASLEVSSFQFMKSKKIRLSPSINSIGQAMAVTSAILNTLQLRGAVECAAGDAETWWFGLKVKAHGSSTNSKRLTRATGKDKIVGWFGFQRKQDLQPQRAIWLYCRTKERAERVKKKVDSLASCELRDGEWHSGRNIEITEDVGKGPTDCEWFLSVFERLGLEGCD